MFVLEDMNCPLLLCTVIIYVGKANKAFLEGTPATKVISVSV